jgi:hypothetical protein
MRLAKVSGVALAADDGLGLDLHTSSLIEQRGYNAHRGCGPDVCERLFVCSADRIGVAPVSDDMRGGPRRRVPRQRRRVSRR